MVLSPYDGHIIIRSIDGRRARNVPRQGWDMLQKGGSLVHVSDLYSSTLMYQFISIYISLFIMIDKLRVL